MWWEECIFLDANCVFSYPNRTLINSSSQIKICFAKDLPQSLYVVSSDTQKRSEKSHRVWITRHMSYSPHELLVTISFIFSFNISQVCPNFSPTYTDSTRLTIVIRNGKVVWKHRPNRPFFLYNLISENY